MTTVDYIHLPASPANWIDYTQTDFIEEWWNNNGLFCANWHWIVPRYEGDEDINNYTYKPGETTFDAENILVEGTWENEVAMADLDELAGYLKLLQDKNIPVIWRPLHEAAGNIYEYNNGTAWFWWGSEGAEVYKNPLGALCSIILKITVSITWFGCGRHKPKMMLFIRVMNMWISWEGIFITTQMPMIWLPNLSLFKVLTQIKWLRLSECGSVQNISSQWSEGAKWSYFMPWYDYERTNDVNGANFQQTSHEHADVSWWNDAMSQDYVITLDEMPSLK